MGFMNILHPRPRPVKYNLQFYKNIFKSPTRARGKTGSFVVVDTFIDR